MRFALVVLAGCHQRLRDEYHPCDAATRVERVEPAPGAPSCGDGVRGFAQDCVRTCPFGCGITELECGPPECVEVAEVCDGADVAGTSCSALGYAGGGILGCAGDCGSLDVSGCDPCPPDTEDLRCRTFVRKDPTDAFVVSGPAGTVAAWREHGVVHVAWLDPDLGSLDATALHRAEVDELVATTSGALLSLRHVDGGGGSALYFGDRDGWRTLAWEDDEATTALLEPIDERHWLWVVERRAPTGESGFDARVVAEDGTVAFPDDLRVAAWWRSADLRSRVVVAPTPEGIAVLAVESGADGRQFAKYGLRDAGPGRRADGPASEPLVVQLGGAEITLRTTLEGYDDQVAGPTGTVRATGTHRPWIARPLRTGLPIPVPAEPFALSSAEAAVGGWRWVVGTPKQPAADPRRPGAAPDPDAWHYVGDRLLVVRSAAAP